MGGNFLIKLKNAEKRDCMRLELAKCGIGAKIGSYIGMRMLSQGKYSKVIYARRKDNKMYVAIKILYKSDEAIQMFEREVFVLKLSVQNKCSHVIGFVNDIVLEKHLVIVLELGSMSLRNRLSRVASMKKMAEYMCDIIRGIRFLHSMDIAHRDLKPENMIITSEDTLKLCDFGFSAKCSGKMYTICGTPPYMAPELFKDCKEGYIGNCVDMWAIGCIIYEMIHKQLAFNAVTLQDMIRKIGKVSYAPMKQNLQQVFKNIILGCLKCDPNMRLTCDKIRMPLLKKKGLV